MITLKDIDKDFKDMTKGVTVYCGSATKADTSFYDLALEVGQFIAEAGVPLITGAGRMGMMAAVNEGCMAAGGETIGVIPDFMVKRGWENNSLTQLIVTDGMHSRKATMAKLSRGAIALPGGIGTFEELMELLTWRQLGLYGGNVVVLNFRDYYSPLVSMLRHAVDEHFMNEDHLALLTVAATAEEAVKAALRPESPIAFSPKF